MAGGRLNITSLSARGCGRNGSAAPGVSTQKMQHRCPKNVGGPSGRAAGGRRLAAGLAALLSRGGGQQAHSAPAGYVYTCPKYVLLKACRHAGPQAARTNTHRLGSATCLPVRSMRQQVSADSKSVQTRQSPPETCRRSERSRNAPNPTQTRLSVLLGLEDHRSGSTVGLQWRGARRSATWTARARGQHAQHAQQQLAQLRSLLQRRPPVLFSSCCADQRPYWLHRMARVYWYGGSLPTVSCYPRPGALRAAPPARRA